MISYTSVLVFIITFTSTKAVTVNGCDAWCRGKGKGTFEVKGTGPFCGVSCSDDCPAQGGLFNKKERHCTDLSDGCATGGKICCCGNDDISAGAECGQTCIHVITSFPCPEGPQNCIYSMTRTHTNTVSVTTINEYSAGASVCLGKGAAEVCGEGLYTTSVARTATTSVRMEGQTVYIQPPHTIFCEVREDTSTRGHHTSTGCAYDECGVSHFELVDCNTGDCSCERLSPNAKDCTAVGGCGFSAGPEIAAFFGMIIAAMFF